DDTHCYVATDQSVHCWGENGLNQVGDGTTSDRPSPIRLSGVTATQLSVGPPATCARAADGTVRC
ncbi:MAG TPA: hypothetical protein DEF51_35650, partial [Myxococcales bacterium]|nr:hypothetical protein [Myxococcales bacterium]